MQQAAFLVPFALVTYLGIAEGGYENTVHQEVGIGVLWVLLLGLLAGYGGVLRQQRRGALIALGTLIALAAWTALAIIWSESAGRTWLELARVLSYAGVFALALVLGATGGGGRRILGGVTAAIALIAAIALLSRLQPHWFGPNELADVLPDVRSRLAYPLGYWNALAALLAIGLPLLLWQLESARSRAIRLLAAAALPAFVLVVYLTISRAGAAAALLSLVALTALAPVRLALLPGLLITGVGGTVLIWAASGREALTDGLESGLANSQGDELTVWVLAVGAVAAAALWAYERALGRGVLPAPRRLPLRLPTAVLAGGLVVVLVAAIAGGIPGEAGDAFERFREPTTPSDDSSRLSSASGNGRWQYWTAAVDAGNENPALGIGPGTYEFYWQRNGELTGFIRDAHSLYVEAYGELGVIGLGLLLALSVGVLAAGVRRARGARAAAGTPSAPPPDLTWAAASAAVVAFLFSVAVDWTWEMAVLPVVFLLIAGAILATGDGEEVEAGAGPAVGAAGDNGAAGTGDHSAPGRHQLAAAAALVLALVAIAAPYLSEKALDASQANFRAGDLDAALDDAERARSVQPAAAEPRLQIALVHERAGRYEPAALAAREAIDRERTNWANYLVLSRVEAALGHAAAARAAFAEAERLNPGSPSLDQPPAP